MGESSVSSSYELSSSNCAVLANCVASAQNVIAVKDDDVQVGVDLGPARPTVSD